jgi:hypothetical protein
MSEIYSVEIIDDIAYVTPLKDSSDSHGLAKGNDFIGTKNECEKFISSKEINKIYGLNK